MPAGTGVCVVKTLVAMTCWRASSRLDGEIVKIQFRICLLLPAVGGEILLEVAVAIEQANADEGEGDFAGAFEMIAGENSQAARINGERFVDAELGREIRHE